MTKVATVVPTRHELEDILKGELTAVFDERGLTDAIVSEETWPATREACKEAYDRAVAKMLAMMSKRRGAML